MSVNNISFKLISLHGLVNSLKEQLKDSDLDLTDEGLKLLPRTLKSLRLHESPKITYAGFAFLPDSLTDLDLVFWEQISEDFILSLPMKLKQGLKSLVLQSCKLSPKSIRAILQAFQNVEIRMYAYDIAEEIQKDIELLKSEFPNIAFRLDRANCDFVIHHKKT